MIKKSGLLARVSKDLKGYKLFSDYLLRLAPHAIVGYALDVSPTWLYVWKCMIPLYDPVPFLNLSLSHRIGEPAHLTDQDGHPKRDMDKLAAFVLDVVEHNPLDDRRSNPEELLACIGDTDAIDLYLRKIRGFARSYIGDFSGARSDLEIVSDAYIANPSQTILVGADQILALLISNRNDAQAKLEEWERDKRQHFEAGTL